MPNFACDRGDLAGRASVPRERQKKRRAGTRHLISCRGISPDFIIFLARSSLVLHLSPFQSTTVTTLDRVRDGLAICLPDLSRNVPLRPVDAGLLRTACCLAMVGLRFASREFTLAIHSPPRHGRTSVIPECGCLQVQKRACRLKAAVAMRASGASPERPQGRTLGNSVPPGMAAGAIRRSSLAVHLDTRGCAARLFLSFLPARA